MQIFVQSKFKRIQNFAARTATSMRTYDHITPVLKELKWLPVATQLYFRNAIMAFKCLTSRVPEYLSSQFTKREEISSKGGAVVRALGSHQCGPGSNPGVEAISGLNLLLVLSLAPRGFSPITLVFPSPQKPTLPNSNSIWNTRTRLNEFVRTPIKCFMGRQITI